MAIQRPITLPAYTPSQWELRLPDYPVITNSWRSSAFPELLGSLPSGAEWKLKFENVSSAQALALLLPWRATAGGQWALSLLPETLAGGVNSSSFRKRLLRTTWTIADEPQKEPVKNGRFNVTINLVYELTLSSLYGPLSTSASRPTDEVLLLGLEQPLSVAGLLASLYRIPRGIAGQPVIDMNMSMAPTVIGAVATTSRSPRSRSAQEALDLNMPTNLQIKTGPVSLSKTISQIAAQSVLDANLTRSAILAGQPGLLVKSVLQLPAQQALDMNIVSGLKIAASSISFAKKESGTVMGPLDSLLVVSLELPSSLLVVGTAARRAKSSESVLQLNLPSAFAVKPQPVELFSSSRFKIAQAVLDLNVTFNPSTAPFSGSEIDYVSMSDYLAVLLHMDGSNNSTTFIDSSPNNFTITAFGDAKIDTSDPRFGTGALLTDGEFDYLRTPISEKLILGTEDFTIDFWCKPYIVNDNDGVLSFAIGATEGTGRLIIAIENGNWAVGSSGLASGGGSFVAGAATANVWKHIALVRENSVMRFYIGGNQIGPTPTWTTNFQEGRLNIGYYYSPGYSFNGLLDEIRVWKGKALFTSNFTPPTDPY